MNDRPISSTEYFDIQWLCLSLFMTFKWNYKQFFFSQLSSKIRHLLSQDILLASCSGIFQQAKCYVFWGALYWNYSLWFLSVSCTDKDSSRKFNLVKLGISQITLSRITYFFIFWVILFGHTWVNTLDSWGVLYEVLCWMGKSKCLSMWCVAWAAIQIYCKISLE